MIKNTKLGIPDSLLVALLFAAGLVDSVVLIGLAVYVLWFEKEDRVKDAAKKALLIFGIFAVLQGGLHALDYVLRILLTSGLEAGYNNLYVNLSYLLSASKIVCYMVFAIKEAASYMALRGTGVCMEKEEEKPASTTTAPSQAQPQAAANVCPKCGNAIDPGVHFCKKCGTKTN